MPTINISGQSGGQGQGLPSSGKGPGSLASTFAGIPADQKILMDWQKRAKVEQDVWKMHFGNEKRLWDEADRANKEIDRKERQAKMEALRKQQEADRKAAQDKGKEIRSKQQWWQQSLRQQDQETRRVAQEQRRASVEEAREQRRAYVEGARAARQRASSRRQAIHAFGIGGAVGGAIGGFAAGDVGGMLGAVGGSIGGGLGQIFGGQIGKAIGTAIGSLAGVAVNPFRAAYGAAKPYFDFQETAYALGRGRGELGSGVESALFQRGTLIPKKALSDVGLSPQDAAAALSSLGAIPQGDLLKTAHTIGLYGNRSDAFAGLGTNAVTGLMSRGLGYGVNSPTDVGLGKMQPFVDALSEANTRGFDKSKILDSMNSSLDSLVQMGGQAGVESIAKLTQTMMNSGMPGGITGASMQNIIAGNAQRGEDILGSNLSTFSLMQLLPKYGNLKTVSDISRWTGTDIKNLPSEQVKNIIQAANAGQFNTALELINTPTMMQPGRLQALTTEAFKQMHMPLGGQSTIFTARAANSSLSAEQIYEQGKIVDTLTPMQKGLMLYNNPGTIPGYAFSVQGNYSKLFKSPLTADAWDKKIGRSGYLKILKNAGISDEAAKNYVDAAEKFGKSPLVAAAVGQQESGNHDLNYFNKSGDYGRMQVNREHMGEFPSAFQPGNQRANIFAGESILADAERRGRTYMGKDFENYAKRALKSKSEAGQGNLEEGSIAAATLVPVADAFAKGVDRFVNAVDKFVSITHMDKAAASHLAHAPATHPRGWLVGMMGAAGNKISP